MGGRFSALSAFGLLPATLGGCDLDEEVGVVRKLREGWGGGSSGQDASFRLGALLARFRTEGRYQAVLTAGPESSGLLAWLEQLFAESTGKEGTGILPVVCDAPPPDGLGPTNLLIHLGSAEGATRERLRAVARAGVPVIHCGANAFGRLAFLYRLQIAVAVAAFRMGVDPYDQPDVEATRTVTRRLAERPRRESRPAFRPSPVSDSELRGFLERAAGGGLVMNAFGHRDRAADALRGQLQHRIAARFGVIPATGFGSGLLHSLGQIEKGGPSDLSILMLSWGSESDVVIPEGPELPPGLAGLGTGAFARLQAAADYQELKRRGRRVLWLDAEQPAPSGLAALASRLDALGIS